DGSMMRGEDQERASPQLLHGRAALRPGTLLEQHELAALKVASRAVEEGDDLVWEGHLAVEVLVQRVPVAACVAEHQRGRTRLPRPVTAPQKGLERRGVANIFAELFGPAVGDLGERRGEGRAPLRDDVPPWRGGGLVLPPAADVARPDPPAS